MYLTYYVHFVGTKDMIVCLFTYSQYSVCSNSANTAMNDIGTGIINRKECRIYRTRTDCRYYPGNWLRGPKKTTKNISQNGRRPPHTEDDRSCLMKTNLRSIITHHLGPSEVKWWQCHSTLILSRVRHVVSNDYRKVKESRAAVISSDRAQQSLEIKFQPVRKSELAHTKG